MRLGPESRVLPRDRYDATRRAAAQLVSDEKAHTASGSVQFEVTIRK